MVSKLNMKLIINKIQSYRVWDSRGNPTIETNVILNNNIYGRSIAPSGASKGKKELLENRDSISIIENDVLNAIDIINSIIDKFFSGKKIVSQKEFDENILNLKNEFDLGSNIMVSLSMAFAHALAKYNNQDLWEFLLNEKDFVLPLPEIQIFGGGAHAKNTIDIQDFMIIPIGSENYIESLELCSRVYKSAGNILEKLNKKTGVADEGGYWPNFDSNIEGFELLLQSIENAGLKPMEDVAISIDIAASEFYKNNKYHLKKDNINLSSNEFMDLILEWVNQYPIISIEDPFDESDKITFSKLTKKIGDKVQIVGDDLLVTNANLIKQAKNDNLCNCVLIKPNQIGTLTETFDAINQSKINKWDQIISARSGETEDTTIMHLAVGWGIKQIKVGSFSRSERMAKWNEGIRIANKIDKYSLHDKKYFQWNK